MRLADERALSQGCLDLRIAGCEVSWYEREWVSLATARDRYRAYSGFYIFASRADQSCGLCDELGWSGMVLDGNISSHDSIMQKDVSKI